MTNPHLRVSGMTMVRTKTCVYGSSRSRERAERKMCWHGIRPSFLPSLKSKAKSCSLSFQVASTLPIIPSKDSSIYPREREKERYLRVFFINQDRIASTISEDPQCYNTLFSTVVSVSQDIQVIKLQGIR
jgi:hypothetical protein